MMSRSFPVLLLLLLCTTQVRAQTSLADRIEDLRCETAIRLGLVEIKELYGFDVSAEAADGVVVLSGFVPTLGARDRVVSFVGRVPGVRVVRSTIRLEGFPSEPIADNIVVGQDAEPEAGRDNSEIVELPAQSTALDGPVFHIVARGDTLFGISRRYDTSIAVISQLNGLSSTTVRVGQRLRVK